jgi:hypothetical protein
MLASRGGCEPRSQPMKARKALMASRLDRLGELLQEDEAIEKGRRR